MSFKPPGYCPNCGDYVEAGAVACETCGSCHDTGWNDENLYDGLDLPEGYDDDAPGQTGADAGSGWGRAALAVGLVAILLWVFVFR